jgi:energy-coupling factor transport system permease protein
MVILSAGIIREWLIYLKFSLMLIFLIILVNALFVHAGATILIQGPRIPIIGTIRITLEALCYGVGMGLRLLVMMGAFCLLTYAVHPDRVLKALGGGRSKTMLTLSISLRLFQRCRGVNFQARDPRVRIRKYVPVLNTVLLSSLERSFQLAESLQSRGYGSTRRTCYREVLRRPRDYMVIMMILLGLGYALILILSGSTGYSYYPRLQPVKGAEITMAVGLGLFFMFPALLNWGWERCRFLKSKI